MHQNSFRVVLVILLLIISGCAQKPKTISIDDTHTFQIELADTAEEKRVGLSNHTVLPEGHGMLFKFESKVIPGFWMKDMQFPIDIVWIEDHMVVGIESNIPLPTSTNLSIYRPGKAINWALELNAGEAQAKGIRTGSSVKFNLDTL